MEARLIAQSAPAAYPANINSIGATNGSSSNLKSLILNRLDEEQANDVVSIDLAGKSDVADAMIIASGRSQRHVGAVADKIARELKEAGHGTVSIEGLPACDWVLIDAGDVIVHLFRPEVRDFYRLERIWAPELFAGDSDPAAGFSPSLDAVEVASTRES